MLISEKKLDARIKEVDDRISRQAQVVWKRLNNLEDSIRLLHNYLRVDEVEEKTLKYNPEKGNKNAGI